MITVVLVLCILWYGRVVRPALAVTFIGLASDVVGAITLAFGLLRTDMARLAQAMDQGVYIPRIRWRGLPLWAAKRWGSRDAAATQSYTAEEYTETFWGVVLLIAGFVLQAVGAWLATPRHRTVP